MKEKFMDNIIIIPKDKKQFSAIKTFLEAMKIRFRTEKQDDALMTEEEFIAKIDHSLRQAEEGKGTLVMTKEELQAYLNLL